MREVEFEMAEVWKVSVALYRIQGEMVEEYIEVVVTSVEEEA